MEVRLPSGHLCGLETFVCDKIQIMNFDLFVAIGVLLVGFSFSLFLQIGRGYSYQSHPLVYALLYLMMTATVFVLVDPRLTHSWLNMIGIVGMLLACVLFMVTASFQTQWFGNFAIPKKLPRPAYHLIDQDIRFAVVKILDIMAQHASFSVVLVYFLHHTEYSLAMIGLLSAVFLLLFHVFCPFFFGPFVGYYFLLLPTFVVFGAPVVVSGYEHGLHLLFMAHIVGYIILPFVYKAYVVLARPKKRT